MKIPTKQIKAVHQQLPLPQAPAWSNYWTFVTAIILMMFVLYLAKNNRLSVWLAFFTWTSPAQIGTTGAPSNAQSVGGQLLNGPAGNASIPATTPGQANAIPWGQVGQGLSKAWNSLINPSFLTPSSPSSGGN